MAVVEIRKHGQDTPAPPENPEPPAEAAEGDDAEPARVAWVRPSLVRLLFGRSSPLAHLLLSVATGFCIVELIIAYACHLTLLPFAICILGFLVLICYALAQNAESSLRISRILTVISLLKTLAIFVGVTGEIRSPYLGVLYLPVFLSCLYYGLTGGLISMASVCVYLCLLMSWELGGFHNAFAHSPLLTQCGVFALVSITAALFAERLRQTTAAAIRRASAQANLVKRSEWFTDTSVMLQALDDLDVLLSVALMRIEDLIPIDSAAIYLRNPEETAMTLAQSKGMPLRRYPLQSIPLARLGALRDPEFVALFVPDIGTKTPPPLFFEFASFDPSARSVIVAPLKNFEELFGVICVGCGKAGALSRKDRDNLAQLAQHIVYPIQRVRLEAIAATDALTGLHNSRAFHGRLRDEVGRALRYEHPLALVLIDIDHFKRVNDGLGHRAGDAILTQIGAILRRSTRGIDFAARYGGEELVVLCPESTDRDAFQLAERVRVAVAETRFDVPGGGTTRITVSAGVAMLSEKIESDAALIEAADKALYRAKNGGRNRAQIASL